jgi:hypothetical protein
VSLASGSTAYTALETLLRRGIFVPIGGAFAHPRQGAAQKLPDLLRPS